MIMTEIMFWALGMSHKSVESCKNLVEVNDPAAISVKVEKL